MGSLGARSIFFEDEKVKIRTRCPLLSCVFHALKISSHSFLFLFTVENSKRLGVHIIDAEISG